MDSRYKALIIDDESPARDIVREYLKNWDEIDIVGEAFNGFDALKLIQELNPDILFLDVQMPKITGLELVEVLDNCPEVVFITAFDQFALKAFELSAVDYLMKPFSTDRFNQAVSKVLEKLKNNQPNNVKTLMEHTHSDNELLNRLVVKSGSKLVVIPIDDVLYFEAQEDYVMIHSDKGRFMKSQTMKFYEEHLPESQFVRIHRSYIVNVNKVERLEPYDKENYVAVLSSDIKLRVSRSGYKKLKDSLRF